MFLCIFNKHYYVPVKDWQTFWALRNSYCVWRTYYLPPPCVSLVNILIFIWMIDKHYYVLVNNWPTFFCSCVWLQNIFMFLCTIDKKNMFVCMLHKHSYVPVYNWLTILCSCELLIFFCLFLCTIYKHSYSLTFCKICLRLSSISNIIDRLPFTN